MVDLSDTVRRLFIPGKGILAADETEQHADSWLSSHGIAQGGKEMRREYRDVFLAAPDIETYLSGVIFHEETLAQKASDGTPFPDLLRAKGIIPGIKIDQGTQPIPESNQELITGGLLGLSKRLHEYRESYGTEFTKWRSVVKIEGDQLPSANAIVENAKRLAMSSRCVQEAGMVPILEPEVLYDGTHSRLRSREVITQTLHAVLQAIEEHAVDPAGLIIKTSMALSGTMSKRMDTPEEVAEATLAALMESLPHQVGGVVFLSGGQTPEQATINLRAISKLAQSKNVPWPITFSFSRALFDEGVTAWKGKEENMEAARAAYLGRLKEASEALSG